MASSERIKKVEQVLIHDLKPNPRNRNRHSEEQINRLVGLIEYQGFRLPIVVSNRTGYMVAGHGRLMAAKKMGLETVPVTFQDFENEDQEYAFMVSDNAIASWADLDLAGVNSDLGDLGPDLDIDMLGIQDFSLDPNFEPGSENDQSRLDKNKRLECPSCGVVFEKSEAKTVD